MARLLSSAILSTVISTHSFSGRMIFALFENNIPSYFGILIFGKWLECLFVLTILNIFLYKMLFSYN